MATLEVYAVSYMPGRCNQYGTYTEPAKTRLFGRYWQNPRTSEVGPEDTIRAWLFTSEGNRLVSISIAELESKDFELYRHLEPQIGCYREPDPDPASASPIEARKYQVKFVHNDLESPMVEIGGYEHLRLKWLHHHIPVPPETDNLTIILASFVQDSRVSSDSIWLTSYELKEISREAYIFFKEKGLFATDRQGFFGENPDFPIKWPPDVYSLSDAARTHLEESDLVVLYVDMLFGIQLGYHRIIDPETVHLFGRYWENAKELGVPTVDTIRVWMITSKGEHYVSISIPQMENDNYSLYNYLQSQYPGFNERGSI